MRATQQASVMIAFQVSRVSGVAALQPPCRRLASSARENLFLGSPSINLLQLGQESRVGRLLLPPPALSSPEVGGPLARKAPDSAYAAGSAEKAAWAALARRMGPLTTN